MHCGAVHFAGAEMNAAHLVVWLGMFVTAHAQTDVVFTLSEYVVDEEVGTLGISLSAGLNALQPNEGVVATIALSAAQSEASATPFGGQGNSDFVLTVREELSLFSSEPVNVTFFPRSEVSTVHNITIVGDNVYEGFESFYLEITQIYAENSLRDQLRIGSPSSVRVTIIDNDVLQVRFRETRLDVDEGQTAVLQGEIDPESSPFQRPLTIGIICFEPLSSNLQGITPATEDIDFVARGSYSLTFTDVGRSPSSGVLSSSDAEVQTKDDDIAEGTESFVCALRLTVSPSDPLRSADPDTITVSIIDDDMLTLQWAQPLYFFGESVDALVALVASNDFTVNFTIPGMPTEANGLLVKGVTYGMAESEVDFEGLSSVAFGFSTITGRVSMNSFIIHDDDVLEDDEVFLGTFSIPSLIGATEGEPSRTNIVIIDDDPVTVNFHSAHIAVPESGGTVEVFLVVEGKFAVPLTVNVHCRATQPESAINGSDFLGITRVVEFLPNEPPGALTTSAPIAVAVLDDGLLEADEDFVCEITNISHRLMMIGTVREALITILDDDQVTVQYSAPLYTAVEEGGQVSLSLLLLGEAAIPVTVTASAVPLDTGSQRAAATLVTDFQGLSLEVTFNPSSERNVTFQVVLIDDHDPEPLEYFSGDVSTKQPRVIIGQPSQPLVEIADTDRYVSVSLASSEYTVLESAGFVEVCVTLNDTYFADITVTIQLSDRQDLGERAATGGADYASGDLTITVTRLSTNGCVNITVEDDAIVERDELFLVGVVYTAGQPGVLLGSPSKANVTIVNDDTLQVSMERNVLRVNESAGDVVLHIVATGLASFDYEVTVTPVDGTATQGVDYQEMGGQVITLRAGTSMAEVRYSIINDDLFEGTESFRADLMVGSVWVGSGVHLGTPNKTVIEITDNEALSVFFQPAVYNTSEGSAVLLVLVADRKFTIPVTVALTTRNGSAVQGLDFGGQDLLVSLDVTSQSAQVSVQTLHDDLCEGLEQFSAALSLSQHSATPSNVAIGSPGVATVGIEDLTGVCVSFVSTADSVREGEAANLSLTLDKTCPYPLHVNITLVDGTAVAPDDYAGGQYSLWFDPGSQTATQEVRTNADSVLEMTESFVAMVTSDLGRLTLCDPSSSTISIEDGTRAEVFFNPPEYGVKEGDAATLMLGLSTQVSSGVLYRITVLLVNGTAHSPVDFVGEELVVQFSGSNMAVVEVPTLQEVPGLVEGMENFTARIVVPFESLERGISIGTPSTATVDINDCDELRVFFTRSMYFVNESAPVAPVTVEASRANQRPYTVTIAVTDGTATYLEDYNLVTFDLTFDPGSLRKTFEVAILNDAVAEGSETVLLEIFVTQEALHQNVLPGEPIRSQVVIVDDDGVSVFLHPANYTVIEGDSATITVATEGAFSVPFDVLVALRDGTAVAGTDYNLGPASYRLTFQPGTTSVQLSVTTIDDTVIEAVEQFEAFLVIPANSSALGVREGSPDMASVDIVDNDGPLEVFFQPTVYDVSEGTMATITLVTSTPNYTFPFTVSLVYSDTTATVSVDYSPLPQSVSFAAGQGRLSFEVEVLEDQVLECLEHFSVMATATAKSDVVTIGTANKANVAILDKPGLAVSFNPSNYTVAEGNNATLVVEADKDVDCPFTIDIMPMPVTAMEGQDYQGGQYTAMFERGLRTATVAIPTVNDTILEGEETFAAVITLTPSASELGVVLGTSDVAVVDIIDTTGLSVSFNPNTYSVSEGQTVNITLTADKVSAVDFQVLVSLEDISASGGVDYENLSPYSVEFTSGSLAAILSVPTFADSTLELVELFRAVLTVPTSSFNLGVRPGAVDTATVDIQDTNEAIVVFFDPVLYNVTEGQNVSLSLQTSSTNFDFSFDVSLMYTDGLATTGEDYSPAVRRVTFDPQQGVVTFELPTIHDDHAELTEDFLVTIVGTTTSQSKVTIGQDTATVSILDNDERVEVTLTASDTLEGSKYIQVCVTKSRPSRHPLEVEVIPSELSPELFAVGDDKIIAQAGTDFGSDPQVVQLSPQELQQCVNMTVRDDLIVELDERVNITVAIPDNQDGVLGGEFVFAAMSSTVSIIDDDDITVMFERPKYTTMEEEARPVDIKIITSGAASFPYIVNISLVPPPPWGRNATVDKDFVFTNIELTVEAGQMELLLPVPIIDDEIFESTEFFQLELAVKEEFVAQNVSTGTPNITTVMIMEVDNITVYFEPSVYNTTEGQKVTVTLVTDRVFEQPFIITVETESGSAVGGLDYNVEFFLAQFMPGSRTADIFVSTKNDSLVELKEEFLLIITGVTPPDAAVITGDPAVAKIIICDRTGEVPVQFEEPVYTVKERTNQTVNITVVTDVDHSFGFTVQIRTTDGTATDGEDYGGGTFAVEFPPGVNTVTLLVAVSDDDKVEMDETFTAHIVIPDTASAVGVVTMTPDVTTVTILDDDNLVLSYNSTDHTVREDDGPLEVVLMASRSASFEYSVTVTPTAVSANADEDFDPLLLTAVFAPGQRVASVFLDLVDNALVEQDERLTLQMEVSQDLTNKGVSIEGNGQATVTILDNDVAVRFAQDKYSFKENDVRGTVTVATNGDTSQPFTVVVHSRDGTATEGEDYLGKEFELKFEVDITSMSFQVPVVSDKLSEETENFTLIISVVSPATRVGIASPETTLVLILDISDLEAGAALNDTVVGDPLFTIPILHPNPGEFPEFEGSSVSLCFEFAGSGSDYYNLISDKCTSVNARYVVVDADPIFHVISEIGIKSEGNSVTCHEVHVTLEGCTALVDGQPLNGTYRQEGVVVFAGRHSVRVEVPNCVQGRQLIMWVSCTSQQGVDMLHFQVTRGSELDPTSHGLIGQFWNIPSEVARYTGTYGSTTVDASAGIYEVTVWYPDSAHRSFLAEFGGNTWDNRRTPCLYAGDSVGGAIWEAPSRFGSIIEGKPEDYVVGGLTEHDFTFDKYISSC